MHAERSPGQQAGDTTRPADASHKSAGSFVGLEALLRPRYDNTATVTEDATLCGGTRAGFAQWLGPNSGRTCTILRDLLRVPAAMDNPEENSS